MTTYPHSESVETVCRLRSLHSDSTAHVIADFAMWTMTTSPNLCRGNISRPVLLPEVHSEFVADGDAPRHQGAAGQTATEAVSKPREAGDVDGGPTAVAASRHSRATRTCIDESSTFASRTPAATPRKSTIADVCPYSVISWLGFESVLRLG